MDIFSRLPVKSIARCRCVSKLCAFILGRPDFTELFLTRSSARPRLSIAYEKDSELIFFSIPQNDFDKESSPVAHMKVRCGRVYQIFSTFGGLFLFRDYRILKGRKRPVIVWTICNPSTGQSFTLPKMMKKKRNTPVRSFFGYDPIDKQCKVLAMTWAHDIDHAVSKEHQVLTLGGTGEKPSWRMIECGIPHYPGCDGICINGVLYYIASANNFSKGYMIVCFNVRSEKFSVIELLEAFDCVAKPTATLINYKGKLASFWSEGSQYMTGTSRSFEIWVLEDHEKPEWSKQIYMLPMLRNVLGEAVVSIVGVTGTNELVCSPDKLSDQPFYVFYYNLERRTFRRVEIHGMGARTDHLQSVFTLLDHVQDVKLMQPF